MENTTLMTAYLKQLDAYREDPNRQNKDLLLEAEYDMREDTGMSTASMDTL